jgi:uncharacterized protein (TIGR03435 family)
MRDSVARAMNVILAVGLICASHALAQVADSPAAFEAASIRLNLSGASGAHYRFLPGFNAENATLMNLIALAYDVADFRILAGPGWIDSDRYDVEAKTEGNPGLDEKKLMIQTLLADRFRLKIHRETKQLPIYMLTMAKGGIKMQPVKEGSCIVREPGSSIPAPGRKLTDYCGLVVSMGRGRLELGDAKMADLVTALTRLTGRTVVDETGIKGAFTVRLTFSPDIGVAADPSADAAGPSIFTAVQEQLGLKLESSRGPVEALVIDHVERPSEN